MLMQMRNATTNKVHRKKGKLFHFEVARSICVDSLTKQKTNPKVQLTQHNRYGDTVPGGRRVHNSGTILFIVACLSKIQDSTLYLPRHSCDVAATVV